MSNARAREASPGPELEEKLARYTVRPCPGTDASRRPRQVVLVPPRTPLGPGFALARRLLARGEPVRLAGVGATLPRLWPTWAREVPGLWLTEIKAYHRQARWEVTRPLREALKGLADELFDGAFDGLRGSEVFYPHIGMRAFLGAAFIMPISTGLAEAHARDSVVCTHPEWPGFTLYKTLAGHGSPSRSRWPWRARIAGLSALGWAASIRHIAATYRRSREGLAELRRRPRGRSERLWLHVFPDHARANVALVEATADRRVDLLLHGDIGRGERDEVHLTGRHGRELWPGLRPLDEGRVGAWETTSIPPTALSFTRSCLTFTWKSAVAAHRLACRPPTLSIGDAELDLIVHAYSLVKLLTIDLARVCMADGATSDLVRRYDFSGATVLSAGSHTSDAALTMRRLRAAGATTVDFAHGWSGEPIPFTSDPPCSHQCVWSATDVGDGDVQFLVGGMPVPQRLPKQRDRARVHVLVMSNYFHRDDEFIQWGMAPYQDEVLEVVRQRADRYAFRWRPHPADFRELVDEAARNLPAEVSRGRPLEEDLAWADVVISTLSTAMLKALLLDLPLIVHVTPDLESTPPMAPFAPSRMFFYATDGVARLDAVVGALADADLLAPDRRARTLLFGETGFPGTLADAIARLLSAPPSSHPARFIERTDVPPTARARSSVERRAR